jgi:hypothetical protein
MTLHHPLPPAPTAAARPRSDAAGSARLGACALLVLLALFAMLAFSALAAPRPAAAQGNAYGVNVHAPIGADLTLIMNRLQAAGIGWARVVIVWPYVEGKQGVYDWSVYDAIVASAQAHNVNIMATILYTPSWATQAPDWTGVPDTAAWTDFCTQAARRYRTSIQYWELWNEPNLAEFWDGTRQQYIAGLLLPGIGAIRAGNPNAKVGGPALSHLQSAKWYDWLNDVMTQAGASLDFVTHHVYDTDGNRAVLSKLNDSTLFGSSPNLWDVDPPSVREVLQYTGTFGKPFWLTETGWQSGVVGEATQASYLGGMLVDWFGGFAGQTWMDKIFFYEIEDPSGPPNSTYGLLNVDGSPKQAYSAYQSFILGSSQTPPPPPTTTDNATLVSGNLPKTMDSGQTITVSLTFQNTGTSTWTAAANYKLGAPGDSDPFAPARLLLAAGDSVAPGQQTRFTFALTAPATPGVYTTHWQMLREGVAWFGAIASQAVTVAAAPPVAARTLSLLGSRFDVSVSWHDAQSGDAGFGHAVQTSDETGTFWFFTADNVELVIKELDGRPVNKSFWFFYGALSDVEYWITVTDQVRGIVQTYYNPPGNLCGKADTSAFPSIGAGSSAASAVGTVEMSEVGKAAPVAVRHAGVGRWVSVPLPDLSLAQAPAAAAAGGPCVPGPQTLCLLGGRFRVSVDWQTTQGTAGQGTAADVSDATGTFAFFDPQAVDLVVKVLDGRSLTGDFWFFYGALSDVDYAITLTDTVTGAAKQYHNAQGNFCGLGDTSALN